MGWMWGKYTVKLVKHNPEKVGTTSLCTNNLYWYKSSENVIAYSPHMDPKSIPAIPARGITIKRSTFNQKVRTKESTKIIN